MNKTDKTDAAARLFLAVAFVLWLKTKKFVQKIKKATVDYGKISYGILKTREEGYVLGTYQMLLSAAISV